MIWLEAEKMVEAADLEGKLNEVVLVDVVGAFLRIFSLYLIYFGND